MGHAGPAASVETARVVVTGETRFRGPTAEIEPAGHAVAETPRSQPEGVGHGPECACARCRGFTAGNGFGLATRFAEANVAGRRHGFYVSPRMRSEDAEEVADLAAAVVAMMPMVAASDALAVELLAVRLWRWRRAIGDISEHGEIRDGKEAPILRHLEALERAIDRSCSALGLSPQARAQLGLDVARAHQAETLTELAARARLEPAVDGETVEEAGES